MLGSGTNGTYCGASFIDLRYIAMLRGCLLIDIQSITPARKTKLDASSVRGSVNIGLKNLTPLCPASHETRHPRPTPSRSLLTSLSKPDSCLRTRQHMFVHLVSLIHPLCSEAIRRHTWIAEVRLVPSCLVTLVFYCIVYVLVDFGQAGRGDVGGGL
jgi:hypothetical protein